MGRRSEDSSSYEEESDEGGQPMQRNFRTSHLLANPEVVQRRTRRHRDDKSRRKPEIEFVEESSEYEEVEETTDEEGEMVVGGDSKDRGVPWEDPHTEKVKYLTALSKYAMRNDEVSRVIPNKRYGLDTPLSELKEVVELCEAILQEKRNAISTRLGVRNLNKATEWMAGMLEAANVNLLDPEAQFALDGFHDSIEAKIEAGEFQEVHEQMWEILRPKIGVLENPFMQWAMIFGMGAAGHVMNNKKAYAEGTRPDPRKHRQQLKELADAENAEAGEDEEEVEELGDTTSYLERAKRSNPTAGIQPKQSVGVMGAPLPVNFDSENSEGEEPEAVAGSDTGYGTGLPPVEDEPAPIEFAS